VPYRTLSVSRDEYSSILDLADFAAQKEIMRLRGYIRVLSELLEEMAEEMIHIRIEEQERKK